jgi:hypothetical protein
MRTLSRAALFTTLAAAAMATTAQPAAAVSSAGATLTPNKSGTITVGAPTTIGLNLKTPDRLYDNSGQTRLKAIKVNMPEEMLFNTTGFAQCNVAKFIADKVCPASTKLAEATVMADAGPDFPDLVKATAEIYFGSGFTVLAYLHTETPAVLDIPVVGELRSSATTGYGLQIYIPVPADIAQPLERVYPVIKSMETTVTPPIRSVKLPGDSTKTKLPLAGLGVCRGKINFQMSTVYTDENALIDKATDSAATTATCKK